MTRLATAGLAALAMSSIAFAVADAGKGGKSPTPVPASGATPQPVPASNPVVGANDANAAGDKVIPPNAASQASKVYLPITADIPLPEKRPSTGSLRGAKSIYPFETLEIGQSFGISDKTWKNVSSTVASANARYAEPDKLVALTNADGSPKMLKVPLGNGQEAEVQAKGPARQFWGCAVDPKSDPHGASVRVWRLAVDDPRLVKKPRKAKAA
jgi:hypothetical protein